jgi:hypothetical protein
MISVFLMIANIPPDDGIVILFAHLHSNSNSFSTVPRAVARGQRRSAGKSLATPRAQRSPQVSPVFFFFFFFFFLCMFVCIFFCSATGTDFPPNPTTTTTSREPDGPGRCGRRGPPVPGVRVHLAASAARDAVLCTHPQRHQPAALCGVLALRWAGAPRRGVRRKHMRAVRARDGRGHRGAHVFLLDGLRGGEKKKSKTREKKTEKEKKKKKKKKKDSQGKAKTYAKHESRSDTYTTTHATQNQNKS